VIANDHANAVNAAEIDDGEVLPSLGAGPRLGAGPSAPPPSPSRGPTSTHNWLKHASSRLSSRRNIVLCGCSELPTPEKPPRVENAHASWADKPAIASTPTSTLTT
jgi:hypothetical protein